MQYEEVCVLDLDIIDIIISREWRYIDIIEFCYIITRYALDHDNRVNDAAIVFQIAC